MNSRELEYIKSFSNDVRAKCSCKGLKPFCECNYIIKKEIKKITTNIPLKYLAFTFEDIDKITVQEQKKQLLEYIEKLDFNFKNGFGLFLYGDRGYAKTVLGSLVLIEVLNKGYSVFFTTLDQCLKGIIGRDEDYLKKLYESDFVMLDGLGNEVVPDSGIMNTILNNLIRSRGDSLRPTIITTNKTVHELEKHFNTVLQGLLKEYFIQIKFGR